VLDLSKNVKVVIYFLILGLGVLEDIQFKSETAHSVAHEPQYLVMSILPHEATALLELFYL